jgi:hypothetical protein
VKLRVLILVLAGACLALPPQARASCPGNTTATRLGCLVTTSFNSRHLAISITNARDKTIALRRNSTFLQVTTTTYNALYSQVAVRRSERLRLESWSCTYTPSPAGGAGTATCNPVTGNYYLCANPANQFHQIYHLDSNPNGTCN